MLHGRAQRFLLGFLVCGLLSAGRPMAVHPAREASDGLELRVAALEAREGIRQSTPGGSLLARIEELERAEHIEAQHAMRTTPHGSPVPGGVVTSGASRARFHPILRRVLPHTGVDIGARAGAPIMATADGVVSSRFDSPTYGLGLDLHHGRGSYTRYAHMQRVVARPGERVARGDVIGFVGSTGRATGPHLHYEVFVRWRRVDPAMFLPDSMPVAGTAGWATDF
jgi:murein DD-endopeptidase MepM/ murein hydrolase activator NlpD